MFFLQDSFNNSIEKISNKFLNKIKYGSLNVIYPSKKSLEYNGEKDGYNANIVIHNFKFFSKVFKKGSIGFAESYIDGDFSTSNLTNLLMLAFQNEKYFLSNIKSNWIYYSFAKFKHYLKENTKLQSKKNIKYHYDLGNEFYKKWLDQSMTYSSGIFSEEKENLTEAQIKKYNQICDILKLNNKSNLLEIGCGWGGFSTYVAKKFGCKVDAITISKKQYEYTSNKIQLEGLNDKVKVLLKDYRDISYKYSNIASIEMFEAVGKKYWHTFFNTIKNSLTPNGLSVLQIITIDENRAHNYQTKPDFIQQYIFPGGMLPSKSQLNHFSNKAGLKIEEYKSFNKSYAKTLNIWNEKFQLSWDELSNMGFNLRFKRMWEYYFSYCETGFLSGSTDVSQFIIQK